MQRQWGRYGHGGADAVSGGNLCVDVVRLVQAATPISVRADVNNAVPQWEKFFAKEDVAVGEDAPTGGAQQRGNS